MLFAIAQQRKNVLSRAHYAGYVVLIGTICSLALSIMVHTLKINNNIMLQVLDILATLIVTISYFTLLAGFKTIALERNNEELGRAILFLMRVIAFMLPVMLLKPLIVRSDLAALVYVSFIFISMVPYGVASIRTARGMRGYDEKYFSACRRSLAVSGWLMTSLVLALPGAVLSLIADWYIWMIVRERTKKEATILPAEGEVASTIV